MKNKSIGIAGILIVSLIILVAVFSGVIAPYDAHHIAGAPFQKPSAAHLLGTNDIGQDIFSELLVGARYSLLVGFITMCIASSLGIPIGVFAGWYGGKIDSILMRLTTFVHIIPYLPLVIILSALLNGGPIAVSVVMGVSSWPAMARVLRAQTMKIKNSEYITSIAAMGAGSFFLLTRHVFRELVPLIVYRMIDRYKRAIIAESTLSFLGLAASTTKSWGAMLYYAQAKSAFLTNAWIWWVLPPGIMISLLSFGLMLIGYSIEGRMNPRLDGDAT